MNPETSQRIGIVFIAGVLIAVGVYDVYATLFLPPSSNISVIIFELAKRHPILPFGVGVVMGHLFWPQ